MRVFALEVCVMCLLSAESTMAQMVTTERLRALHLDSLPGPVVVYHSPGISAGEAAEVQQLMQNCITKYRDSIGAIPTVTVAVLDSMTWTRVTSAPYGIPHHNFSASPIPIVVPVTAAAIVGNVVPPERANRFFRLLALHELGHVLTFAAVRIDPRDLGMPPRFPVPGWYNEFAADYFRLSCLSPSDREAGISSEWLRSNRPLYPLLDDGSRLHEKRLPDGKPYFGTSAYFLNGSWIMGVIGEAARLQLPRLGDGFLALLREQWHRPPGSVSTEEVLNDLMRSNPDVGPWLRSVGAMVRRGGGG